MPNAVLTPPLSSSLPATPIPQLRLYQDWLRETRGLAFADYAALWQWSVTDLDAFWRSMWDWSRMQSPTPPTQALANASMPGAQWFPGTQVNFARQMLAHGQAAHAAGFAAIVSDNELGDVRTLSWPELQRQVASLALALRDAGVARGDRVAAYLPNVPETIVACLAVVSLGAIWSVCAPDMGTAAVIDRFRQIEPVLLIATDGVRYGGKAIDRAGVVAELQAQLPSLRHTLLVPTAHASGQVRASLHWADAVGRNDAATAAFEPEWLPFDHPIWIVYSSGTTGLPKPIVHGHGGILLTAYAVGLHNDLGPSYAANTWGERFHWYSSTGWVMWNVQMSGLLFGTTIVLYDGHPAGAKDPADWGVLWRFAAKHHLSFFGAGAAYFTQCMKAGLNVADCGDLHRIRTLGSTGSPLSEAVQRWGSAQMQAASRSVAPTSAGSVGAPEPAPGHPKQASAPLGGSEPHAVASVGAPPEPAPGRPKQASAPLGGSEPHAVGSVGAPPDPAPGRPKQASAPLGGSEPHAVGSVGAPIYWCNISGGTDFCGAFAGGNRELPEVPGRMQCRMLGHAVESWNEQGQPVIGAVGELVCTRPIPSMPLYFWNDANNARYLASYFDTWPGIWRHGDWLQIDADGGCTIYGRSDATINRQGLRMGTSEIYSAIEALPEVLDAMVVDLEYLGRPSYMPLFVVLRPDVSLDAARPLINAAIRAALSPRFLPDDIFAVAQIPRTLSGKKQELPIKKLLLGQPADKVINPETMANPECLAWYMDFAAQHLARTPSSA